MELIIHKATSELESCYQFKSRFPLYACMILLLYVQAEPFQPYDLILNFLVYFRNKIWILWNLVFVVHRSLIICCLAYRKTWSKIWCCRSRNLLIMILIPLRLFCYAALLILKAHKLSLSGQITVLLFSGSQWLLPKPFFWRGHANLLFWLNKY